MKIGIMIGADRRGSSVTDVCKLVETAEKANIDSVWMAHIRSLDAITALTLAGDKTNKIEIGTAVTPIHPRHPMALAQQALTAAQVCEGRFTLGIGLSHKAVIEDMLGLSYAKPASYMLDYVKALNTLIERKETSYSGSLFNINGLRLDVSDTRKLPLLIAALGPKMLGIAGAYADGTSLWMTGPRTIENHIAPLLFGAAAESQKPTPRIVAGFPIVVTDNRRDAYAELEKDLAIYGALPSYRAMLDREGLKSPADLALVGDEAELKDSIERIKASGVTDFSAAIMAKEGESYDRTFQFIASFK